MSARTDEIAADWAVRVDRAPLEPSEQAEFDAWVASDSRRFGAYARARAVFAHAKRARALGTDFKPEQDQRARPPRRWMLFKASTAIAASIVIAVILAIRPGGQTYKTARGEVRSLTLKDGSSVMLNTASTLTVSFTDQRRSITLQEGEALFDVARDPQRPFIVEAGDTHVRAIGTRFSVRHLTDRPVQVTVSQGVVEVVRPADTTGKPMRVSANTRVLAPLHAALQTIAVPPTAVRRELAWREGMLSFEDLPLSEAVEEFSRYSDLRIQFSDPTIAAETVTGLYAANNPQGFIQAVAGSLDLKTQLTSDGIRVTR